MVVVVGPTPLDNPVTSVGVDRFVVVLSPSCPRWFFPQHLTAPVESNAQVWNPPAVMTLTPPDSPVTSVWCGPVCSGAVTDAPISVFPPAFCGAGGEQCAGVFIAGGDGSDSACKSGDLCGGESVRGGAVTDAPKSVIAPAFCGAGGEQCAGVESAGSDDVDTA